MKTAMIELRDKLLEVYDKEKESSIDNEYLKGYTDCLKNIATDIDAQMNDSEIDKNIEFADWLATNFVPTSSCGKVIYWQQKNYQGKEKFTTDKVYNIYVSEPTKIAQKNEFVIPAVSGRSEQLICDVCKLELTNEEIIVGHCFNCGERD